MYQSGGSLFQLTLNYQVHQTLLYLFLGTSPYSLNSQLLVTDKREHI